LYKRQQVQHLRSFPLPHDVRCVQVVNEQIWVASRDGSIHIRDIQLGHKLGEIKAQGVATRTEKRFYVNAIHKHGENVWVGSSDGVLRVYNAKGSRMLYELNDHTGGVKCIVGNAESIWSSSEDFTILQRSPLDGLVVKQLVGHTSWVHCLVVNAVTGQLWSGSADGKRPRLCVVARGLSPLFRQASACGTPRSLTSTQTAVRRPPASARRARCGPRARRTVRRRTAWRC
jgi:WD40 repeat protein